ncbi:MAG: group II intron reverse transcriptase/maturase [Anaerolineales bacterium]|nr:group II intron reverse transcriptase/maturase [Anaerolineales bacterium]
MVDVIQELGHLEKLAKEDHEKRFNRLYRLLRQEQFLAYARASIAGNKGAHTPGIDGQTIDDITPKEITKLCQELATGKYQPQPVQRRYIPKRSGKLRPLGLPASREKVIQSGVALILNALYEPLFLNCSHGFRPKRSPITALRQVSNAYRAGATWIIEGDITDCFGSLPHQVILNCLRKRIRDERFIDLIRKMLQAGVMEDGYFITTYSGAPQGGIASPILSNIVLHELDCWMESQMGANPPAESSQDKNARSNPDYMRLHYRICDIRRYLDGKRPMPRGATPEELRQELREKLRLRRLQPRSLPRRVVFYSRFADDFVVVLCHHSKAEARQVKAAIATWMQTHLGLTLHQEKTHITHWRKLLRFLGYNLEGRQNPSGTGWLHLSVPKDAVRNVVAKIKRATAYSQAPEYDVFTNVNAVARGWSNFYRYAHDNNVVGGKLSTVIYWRTAHYLGKKHRCSIAKMMRKRYARSSKTGCKALFTHKPGKPATPENRYFIWHKTLPRLSLASATTCGVQDKQTYIDTGWAKGRSRHKRCETRERGENKCQSCGTSDDDLFVHHPKRLRNAKRVKKGAGHVAQSGLTQQTKLLCYSCHLAHHHGNPCQ